MFDKYKVVNSDLYLLYNRNMDFGDIIYYGFGSTQNRYILRLRW